MLDQAQSRQEALKLCGIDTDIDVDMDMDKSINLYIHIYIYTHMHIYMYICIYIHACIDTHIDMNTDADMDMDVEIEVDIDMDLLGTWQPGTPRFGTLCRPKARMQDTGPQTFPRPLACWDLGPPFRRHLGFAEQVLSAPGCL